VWRFVGRCSKEWQPHSLIHFSSENLDEWHGFNINICAHCSCYITMGQGIALIKPITLHSILFGQSLNAMYFFTCTWLLGPWRAFEFKIHGWLVQRNIFTNLALGDWKRQRQFSDLFFSCFGQTGPGYWCQTLLVPPENMNTMVICTCNYVSFSF
jgi:hypothetical protein